MSKKKHEGLRAGLDKVEDAVGGMVGTASASVAGSSTATFIEKARIGDLYEIEAARIALQRARNPAVQALATRIIEDHMTSSHHLMSALRTNEVDGTLPRELDSRHATMIEHLQKAADADFDSSYLDQQKLAHQETLTLFESYATSGDNPQLASLARGTIPALREHRQMAEGIDARTR